MYGSNLHSENIFLTLLYQDIFQYLGTRRLPSCIPTSTLEDPIFIHLKTLKFLYQPKLYPNFLLGRSISYIKFKIFAGTVTNLLFMTELYESCGVNATEIEI